MGEIQYVCAWNARSCNKHYDISLSPVVPSQSQIGQGQSPLTCLAYNKGDNQISQTSGTSLTESGKPTSWDGYYAKCMYIWNRLVDK